jgi:hypothetical protein
MLVECLPLVYFLFARPLPFLINELLFIKKNIREAYHTGVSFISVSHFKTNNFYELRFLLEGQLELLIVNISILLPTLFKLAFIYVSYRTIISS